MDLTFRGVPVVLDSDVNPVDVAYLEGLSQSVVQTVFCGFDVIAGRLILAPDDHPTTRGNWESLVAQQSLINEQMAAIAMMSGPAPSTEEKPEKRIDEMTLADYRAGIAKVFNGGRLLP